MTLSKVSVHVCTITCTCTTHDNTCFSINHYTVAKSKEDYVHYENCEVDINKYNACMYMYKYMYEYNSWYNIALKLFMC